MKPHGIDRPVSLAKAHERIESYRYALDLAVDALLSARPYIRRVAVLQEIDRAVKTASGELRVTTRIPNGDDN